jgi:mannose-1-phosphate guanylyltransferase
MKVVIFCGGYGTRFWPIGRKSTPKQFYPIINGKSFFQITYRRFRHGFLPKDIMVSTEQQYLHFIRKQAPDIPVENIIVEPERRDLLGAVALVTAVVQKRYGNEVMFFSWADHFIRDEKKFVSIVKSAMDYTLEHGVPVSINEEPTFPSIHNGWIEQGRKVGEVNRYGLHRILRFIEKPKLETAKKYLNDGNYYIHTGYGAWRSDQMMSYFEKIRPDDFEHLVKIYNSVDTKDFDDILKSEYHKFEKISVELGLYEKLPSDLRLNIPMSVGWKDAGTWQLFYGARLEKGEDSVIEGSSKFIQLDAFKNLLVSTNKNKVITIVGLKNIAVIDTKDALLVVDLDSTDKVKQLFTKMEHESPEWVD